MDQQPDHKQKRSYPTYKKCYLRARKEAETDELMAKISRISEENYHLIGYELFEGHIESLITTQEGSIILQAIISKANPMLITSAYYELRPILIELLRQTYANYFCQCIYVKLNDECKHEFIVYVFDNLSMILKNMISFRATTSILEYQIPKSARKLAIAYLAKIDKKMILTHVRYIKIIETILPKLEEVEVDSIIEIVAPIFKELICSKQGYFLIKKLIRKSAAYRLLKGRIVSLIKKVGISEFLSSNNGYLLIKCILKNFLILADPEIIEIEKKSNSYHEHRMQENSNQIENFLYKDHKIVSSHEDSENNLKYIDTDKYSLENSKINRRGPVDEDNHDPIIELFDLLVNDLLFCYSEFEWSKTLSKLHKKTVCFFLELRFGLFLKRLINMLAEIESIQALTRIIRSILLLYQDLSLIENIISFEPHNSLIADLAERLCLINLKDLPKDQEQSWIDLIHHSDSRCEDNSELFNSNLEFNKDATFNTHKITYSDNCLYFQKSSSNLSSYNSSKEVKDKKTIPTIRMFNDSLEHDNIYKKSSMQFSASVPSGHYFHHQNVSQLIKYDSTLIYTNTNKESLKKKPAISNANYLMSKSMTKGHNYGARPVSYCSLNNCPQTLILIPTFMLKQLPYQTKLSQNVPSIQMVYWGINNVAVSSTK